MNVDDDDDIFLLSLSLYLLRSVENSKNISSNEHHRYHCEYNDDYTCICVCQLQTSRHTRSIEYIRERKKSIRWLFEGEIKRMFEKKKNPKRKKNQMIIYILFVSTKEGERERNEFGL